jgi:hypothetical protein
MNICIPYNIINHKNIYFHDPIKNTVINNSHFIRILYSNKYIISSGLHILYSYNEFCDELYNNFIYNNNKLEKSILNLYNSNIKHFYKLEELLNLYYYKLKENKKNKFILKISGIWENNYGIGITSKIIIL